MYKNSAEPGRKFDVENAKRTERSGFSKPAQTSTATRLSEKRQFTGRKRIQIFVLNNFDAGNRNESF